VALIQEGIDSARLVGEPRRRLANEVDWWRAAAHSNDPGTLEPEEPARLIVRGRHRFETGHGLAPVRDHDALTGAHQIDEGAEISLRLLDGGRLHLRTITRGTRSIKSVSPTGPAHLHFGRHHVAVKAATVRIGLIAGLGLALGLLAGWVAYGPGRMPDSLPHLVAGWVPIASGLVAWWRVRWSPIGALLVLLGLTWFMGDFSTCLNIEPLAHRCVDTGPVGDAAAALGWLWLGVLGHILISFPDGRLRTWPRRGAVATAYIVAIAIPAMPDVVALFDRATPGRTLDLAVSLASIAIAAALLATDARRASLTTDRAVGLGDALASALGDPSFRIAFKEPTRDGWVDATGRRAPVPRTRDGLALTPVERDGEVLAVIEHDPATLADPQIRASVTMAVELGAHNTRLRTDLDRQLAEVAASRRRLVDAGLDERRQLAERVDAEVEIPLQGLASSLVEVRAREDDPATRSSLERAMDQLAVARTEIRDLASGLYPRILETEGLAAALRDLATRSSVPVKVIAADGVTAGTHVDATVYFVCAEALANAGRHANASHIRIEVTVPDGAINATIEDDGTGGADPAAGTGLSGLRDRVEAVGGTLKVDSGPEMGTRLVATIPVGREAPPA